MLERECVGACSPAARLAGIRPGMRRAGALAIAPQAILLERSPAAEAQARQDAALALLQYTPQVALAEDGVLLDVGASLQVFGGPRALHRRIAATLRTLGLDASLGMAPHAAGAWLLARDPARGAARRVLRDATLARRLDRLPPALLPQAQARLDWLHDIGCQTLGQLRALPRGGLQRRGGVELLRALDAAYGQAAQVHAWVQPPASFTRRIELTDYVEHAPALLHVAQRLCEQLGGWLAAHQRAVERIVLRLDHERGRHACAPTELTLALAQPAWQAHHLLGLLRERLGRLVLPAPAIAVGLHAPDTVPQPAASTCLFPEPGGTPADHARLLDLLGARLGRERVRRARPAADHRPEQANRWQAAHDPPPAGPAADQPERLERPFWLLSPAQPLSIQQHRPTHNGQALRLVRGPERIESGWWDAALTVRDYFVAEDAAGARYWLYRERDARQARWFLHGLFA